MQDQQNQTRDQRNGRYPCYREYQCLRRRVVPTLSLFMAKIRSKMTAALTPHEERQTQIIRNRFDECHSSDWL